MATVSAGTEFLAHGIDLFSAIRYEPTIMIRSMSIYIIAVLVANYTATWFIPLPVFGMVSVGTLVFGEIVTKFATGAVAALWQTRDDKAASVRAAVS